MLKKTVLIAVLLGCLQLSQAGPCEDWVNCVYAKTAEALHYADNLLMLRFDLLPDDMTKLCGHSTCRFGECQMSDIPRPAWEDRFTWARYINFLDWTGCFAGKRRPDTFLAWKKCYDEELKTALLSCLNGPRHDIPCMEKQYAAHEKCPDDVDKLFKFMLPMMGGGPYDKD